jgi:hypothetical protein
VAQFCDFLFVIKIEKMVKKNKNGENKIKMGNVKHLGYED